MVVGRLSRAQRSEASFGKADRGRMGVIAKDVVVTIFVQALSRGARRPAEVVPKQPGEREDVLAMRRRC